MIIHQENQILLTGGSSKSMSASMIKHTGITNTNIFLQGLLLQYLHKVVNTIVSLQPSLPVSLQDNILSHLYRYISSVMSLQSSLLFLLLLFQYRFALGLPLFLWSTSFLLAIIDFLHIFILPS